VTSGWHPETVQIGSWRDYGYFASERGANCQTLQPFHIWNEQFISDRLKWKPRQPLYILLLRTYKLAQAQIIPYRSEYGAASHGLIWLNRFHRERSASFE